MYGRPKSRLGHGLTAQRGIRPARPAATRTRRLRAGVVTTNRPRVGRCGGSAVSRRRQGVAGEHWWGPGVAPGKEERVGAHRNGGSTARWRKRCQAAVFNGGGVAPVVVDEGC
jgi:hypothetical protein